MKVEIRDGGREESSCGGRFLVENITWRRESGGGERRLKGFCGGVVTEFP